MGMAGATSVEVESGMITLILPCAFQVLILKCQFYVVYAFAVLLLNSCVFCCN